MIWNERKFEETTGQQPAPLDFSTVQAGEGSEHESKDLQSEVSEVRDEKADNSGSECEAKTKQEKVNVDGNEGEGQHS